MGVFEPPAAVVFDAVGTLIDPSPSVAEAYSLVAARQGIVLDPSMLRDRFARAFGRDESDETRGPLSTSEAVERRRWRRIVGAVLPEVPDLDAAFDQLWVHFADPASWRVFDDVGPALTFLRDRGLETRVGSNFDGRLRGVLAGLPALAHLSSTAVVSSQVGHRKPHPAFYLAACEVMGLPPARVLFVGDDRANDLEGPRRAGLRSALLDRRRRDASASPDLPTLLDRYL